MLVVAALVLALLVKTLLVQAFFIPSGSMERTLHGCPGCTGDRVLVNKVVYDLRSVHRGEIVVFGGQDGFGAPGQTDYIKRVIAVGGDRVACCSPSGRVTVQPAGGDLPVELDEPYVFQDDAQPFCQAGTGAGACPPGSPGVLVPPERLWVMGDHRGASKDSRSYLGNADRGTVSEASVIGRAFVIVWPLTRARTLPVPATFDGATG